jgi:hypothetical protein
MALNYHLARSAMKYLLYYTQYMQICQTTCFCYCISKTKNEFGKKPEENIILIGPGQYTKILTPQNSIWLRFGPYNILWVTSRSINCHIALRAMNYLLNNEGHVGSVQPIKCMIFILICNKA